MKVTARWVTADPNVSFWQLGPDIVVAFALTVVSSGFCVPERFTHESID